MEQSETQESISKWATDTFGPGGSNLKVALRAQLEMDELIQCLDQDDNHPKAHIEVADVVIILNRLATRLQSNLQETINQKMKINRSRTWDVDADRHIE